ncbi:MAG: hypothetical protein QW816_01290 [Desulfurococcaceae archaeon]
MPNLGSELSPSTVFKNMIAAKPWLFIIAYYIYSHQGSTVEELRESTGLNTNTLKRGIWWLNKYNVIECRNEKYFIKPEYVKVVENLLYDHCNLKRIHLLKLDKVFIVLTVRNGRIDYWSLPVDYVEKLSFYEEITSSEFLDREIANILGVDIKTARKITRLRELQKACRSNHQTREE